MIFIKILNLLKLKQKLTHLLAIFCLMVVSTSYAAQESGIAMNPSAPMVKDAFEWQLIVDLSLASKPVILTGVEQTEPWDYFQLGLLIDLSYKGFFLQSNARRSSTVIDGGELGYQLTVQNDWELDVILKSYIEGYDPSDIIKNQKNDIPQLAGLDERDFTGGIALRYSRFFDNAIFYIDIAAASADDDASGIIIDSFYSYLVPYRNWDIYFGAGLTYYDQALIDYYIGIDANEVTPDRPLHSADSSFRAQLEIYAQYPLSQSWSFNAGLTQTFYSNSIKQSPLVDKNKLIQLMIGVHYVF